MATNAEAVNLLADALALVCPENGSEAERRDALSLLLQSLVCMFLEDRGLGSKPSSWNNQQDRFAAMHRCSGVELFAPRPGAWHAVELDANRWLQFVDKLRRAKQTLADITELGSLYQQLLEVRPGLDRGRRKATGSYYTPRTLAETTVRRCLDQLLDPSEDQVVAPEQILALRICDPAMGSAAFLIAALHDLATRLELAYGAAEATVAAVECRRLIAAQCLYGVDLDPLCVQLGALLIWNAVGDLKAGGDLAACHLKQGNALVSVGPNGFDWRQEFAEVFAAERGGFDAIIGNPPWETLKPDSRAFFARHDPQYPRLARQAALTRQTELCADPAIASAWQDLLDQHRTLSQHCHDAYEHQGVADLNAYKLFLERGFDLLADGGSLAFLVPAGIYCDRGSKALRELFLNHGRWDWLFGFENRQHIFPIDSRFKFCAILVRKGGRTESIRCAFMQRSPEAWQSAEKHTLSYSRRDLDRFSPNHQALVEFTNRKDREVFRRIHAGGQLLGETGVDSWQLRYGREFDTTLDSHLFPARPTWEQRGYRPCTDGRWLQGGWRRCQQGPTPSGARHSVDGLEVMPAKAITGEALPLFEGRMIEPFSCRAKAWISGRGRRATWTRLAPDGSDLGPQYLMSRADYANSSKARPGPKIAFMRIASATNERSCIATYLGDVPMADSLFLYSSNRGSLVDCLCASAILNSFCFDFQVRCRLGGLNMSEFLMSEIALPQWRETTEIAPVIAGLCARLALDPRLFSSEVTELRGLGIACGPMARARSERSHLRSILDALIADLYHLTEADLSWILHDCDHPVASLRNRTFRSQLSPKGFWRMDRDLPPNQRLPALTMARFRDLARLGLGAFLARQDQPPGPG